MQQVGYILPSVLFLAKCLSLILFTNRYTATYHRFSHRSWYFTKEAESITGEETVSKKVTCPSHPVGFRQTENTVLVSCILTYCFKNSPCPLIASDHIQKIRKERCVGLFLFCCFLVGVLFFIFFF